MTQELYSPGKLAELFQRSPRKIVNELTAMGVEPKLILNGLSYYDVDEAEPLFEKLDELKDSPMIHLPPVAVKLEEVADDE